MSKLIDGIVSIGNQMVSCKLNCNGISNNPKDGIIPRCLFLETQNRNGVNGCLIVGINPGRNVKNNTESNFYKENKCTYDSVVNYWTNHGGYNYPYYKFLRDFLNCAGYSGPILWTELVKCENNAETNFPPLQTRRTCSQNYLSKELELVPADWPIIAIGREVHKAMSYLYPAKSVLGVPHPTSSRGNFSGLFAGKARNKFTANVQKQIVQFKNNPGHEIWLIG